MAKVDAIKSNIDERLKEIRSGYLALYIVFHLCTHPLPTWLTFPINGNMKRDFSLKTIRNYSAMGGMDNKKLGIGKIKRER